MLDLGRYSNFVSNDCDITITNNLWGKKDIVNGCTAIIKDIIYPENKSNESLPEFIIMHIPNWIIDITQTKNGRGK